RTAVPFPEDLPMAAETLSWSRRGRNLLPSLAGRLRPGSWRRWIAVVLAFNIALGMGFSVVLLRHQVDERSRTGVLLAQLDTAVWAQDAELQRPGHGDAATGEVFDTSAAHVREAAAAAGTALASEDENTGALTRAVAVHERVADRVAAALVAGDDATTAGPLLDALATSGATVHRAVAATTARHDDSTS